MSDLSFRFCFQHGVINAVLVAGAETFRRAVQLIDIDVICFQQAERSLQILKHLLTRFCRSLCRDIIPVSVNTLQRHAQLLLTVTVRPCRVKEIHAPIQRHADQSHRAVHIDPLDRKRPKSVFVRNDPCISEFHRHHSPLLLVFPILRCALPVKGTGQPSARNQRRMYNNTASTPYSMVSSPS